MELNEIISKIHDILADIGCSAAAVPVALLLCLANFLKSKFKTQLFFRKLKLSVLCLKSRSYIRAGRKLFEEERLLNQFQYTI